MLFRSLHAQLHKTEWVEGDAGRVQVTLDVVPDEDDPHGPAFINLQQYYVEGYLCDAVLQQPNIDMRWKKKVVAVHNAVDCVTLTVESPEGAYTLAADYVIACDGSRSPVRKALGLESKGQTFRDRFLIADVKMSAPFPTERWFWFDPPFHPNQSVLLHKQPDDVWRIDFHQQNFGSLKLGLLIFLWS